MYTPEWLKAVGVFAIGFLSGVVIPTHYNDALERHRKRQNAARVFLHDLAPIRTTVVNVAGLLERVVPQKGDAMLWEDSDSLQKQVASLQAQERSGLLFDLHDATLQQRIELELKRLDGLGDWGVGRARQPRVYGYDEPAAPPYNAEWGIHRNQINEVIIPNLDVLVAELKACDVSFIAWIFRRIRYVA